MAVLTAWCQRDHATKKRMGSWRPLFIPWVHSNTTGLFPKSKNETFLSDLTSTIDSTLGDIRVVFRNVKTSSHKGLMERSLICDDFRDDVDPCIIERWGQCFGVSHHSWNGRILWEALIFSGKTHNFGTVTYFRESFSTLWDTVHFKKKVNETV